MRDLKFFEENILVDEVSKFVFFAVDCHIRETYNINYPDPIKTDGTIVRTLKNEARILNI